MKRSLMPIMAVIFAFASFVSVVTPASACWWGKDNVARRPLINSQRRETVCFASLIEVALNWQQCDPKICWSAFSRPSS